MSKLKMKAQSTQPPSNVVKLQAQVDTLEGMLYQVLESVPGASTHAAKLAVAEKHLADVKSFHPTRAIPAHKNTQSNHRAKVGSDFLIKGVTPDLPREKAVANFYTALRSPTDDPNLIELQYRCDRIKTKCELLKKKPRELEEYGEWNEFLEKTGFDEIVKLISTSSTTDFIPEGWSNEVQKYYYLALKVAGLFNEFPMPHSPFRWDILGRPDAKYGTEPPASNRGVDANEIDPDDPDQGVITYTARKLTVRVDLTEEFVEDSVDTYYDVLTQEMLPEAMAEGVEIGILNGDSDGSHQDSGTAANSPASAWDGLRKHALQRSATVDVTADSGTFSFDRVAELIFKGGKYAVNPEHNAWIADIKAYAEMLGWSEIRTMLNFGEMATNVQGAIMMFMGRPYVVSEHIPLVHDDGTVHSTAGNNVHGTLLHVNRRQFRIGNRSMEEATQVMFDPLTRVYYFTLTCRKDFKAMEPVGDGYTPVSMTLKV